MTALRTRVRSIVQCPRNVRLSTSPCAQRCPPRIEVSGVRSSCESVARNSSLSRSASRLLACLALAHKYLGAFFCRKLPCRHVKHERQHRYELARLLMQHGVIPLAIQHGPVPGVIAVALNSKELHSQALPICHLFDTVYVFVKNEMPVADVLANYFFGRQPNRRSADCDKRNTRKRCPTRLHERRILTEKSA